MSSIRQDKVAKLIQRELGIIFQQEARSLCGGAMVSVTVVRVSADLGVAKVYLSIFGQADIKGIYEEINAQTLAVRRLLGNRIGQQVRRVPELHLLLDDSLDYAEEIDNLL